MAHHQLMIPSHTQQPLLLTLPLHPLNLSHFNPSYRLIGQVVKASAPKAEGLVFESHLRQDFSGSSPTSDFNIGTPVATLPGTWRYRVSAGTDRLGVSIL